MKLISNILKTTPLKDKIDGTVSTQLGLVCGAVLATGVVTNPIGIVLLTIGAVVFSGKAVFHAQKVER
jgi:hypothetical protein